MTTLSQSFTRVPDHLVEQAKQADLVSLAERYTELRKEAAREWAGPCPKCGGTDRFHVTAEWFFCRHCHPKRGDAIEFMQWAGGAGGFRAAVERLTGAALPGGPPIVRRAPERKAPAPPPTWGAEARELVNNAHKLLAHSKHAQGGRDYLEGRGIDARAWFTFHLGYLPDAPLPGTKGKERAPAIVIPWVAQGDAQAVRAVRFRFLETHSYTDAEGKERTEKQTALANSQFAGLLWGGLGLPSYTWLPITNSTGRCAENYRTLVLCEGEINALSIWLACHETNVDVLSVGSESQNLTPAMMEYAARFATVLVWADRGKHAGRLAAQLPGAYAIKSPGGKDANDLLQAGLLGGFIAAARVDAAKDETQREGVLWDLWDTANSLQGLDTGAAMVMHQLSDRAGHPRRLTEAEPGRWITQ